MSKRIKNDIIENFGGGANSDVAGIYLKSGFVPESFNVDFSIVGGAARKRMGYRRMNSSAIVSSAPITGLYQAKLGNTEVKLATLVDTITGKLYSWDGASTFTLIGTLSGGSDATTLVDFAVTRSDTDGFIVVLADGIVIRKYDGYTYSALDVKGVNGGGDLGVDYFAAKYVKAFKNRLFFANTREGNAALSDDWDATGDPIYKHNDDLVNEVSAVLHSGSNMTYNAGGYAALSANEYDVYERELYVRCTADADPAANIVLQFRAHERIRWSNLDDAEDHNNSNFADVVTEAGKEIMRIMPLRDLLMIYKEDSIWAAYSTGEADEPFGLHCIDHNTPCYAGFSVVDVKGEHFFLSKEGIMKTNGAKVEPVLVSRDVPDWFKNVNKENYQYAYAANNQFFKQYRLLIPNLGGTGGKEKDREIRFDYENGIWSEHQYAGNPNVIASLVNTTSGTWDSETRAWDDITETWDDPSMVGNNTTRFYTGDTAGFVREHDTVEYDDEGASDAINSYLVTKPLNLSQEKDDIHLNKKLLKMRARLASFTGSTITIEKRLDGGAWESEGTIDCAQSGETFEGKIDINGTCKELQYRIGNNASTQPWVLYWILTEYILRSKK